MAIFKSNPEKAVQRDIDAAIANRDRLSAKLAECQEAVVRYQASAKQSALIGNDAELDRAEVALRAAQDRRTTYNTALAEVEQQLVALESTKAELLDRKLRAQTAAETELLAREMWEIGIEFDAAAARLAQYTTRAVPVVFEARGLHEFLNIGRVQVPEAIDAIGKLLRSHASAVLAGMAPAILPRPEELPVTVGRPPEDSRGPVQSSLGGRSKLISPRPRPAADPEIMTP